MRIKNIHPSKQISFRLDGEKVALGPGETTTRDYPIDLLDEMDKLVETHEFLFLVDSEETDEIEQSVTAEEVHYENRISKRSQEGNSEREANVNYEDIKVELTQENALVLSALRDELIQDNKQSLILLKESLESDIHQRLLEIDSSTLDSLRETFVELKGLIEDSDSDEGSRLTLLTDKLDKAIAGVISHADYMDTGHGVGTDHKERLKSSLVVEV